MSETIHKPSGYTGKRTDRYWSKHTRYGWRYMCSKCGGWAVGTTNPLKMCKPTCAERVQAQAEADAKAQAARTEAQSWRNTHEANVIDLMRACDDVDALRTVAKALGYEEGAEP